VRTAWRLPLVTVLASSIAVPAAVVLPTVTPARATPHPVTPTLHTVALSGVDATALRSESAPRSLSRTLAASRPLVLTPELPTASFQTLAVTWLPVSGPAAQPRLTVSARYHHASGWSSWISLGGSMGDTASGAEARGVVRAGTEPYYTGPADGVQVRVDSNRRSSVLPAGLRVDLIDPGTSAADAAVTAAPPVSSASAAATDPHIITRAQWGANESMRQQVMPHTQTYKVAFVHHTAGINNYTAAEGPAIVRGLYSYYVNSLGYADIGYNFLVDKYGAIYVGRYGSMDGTPRQAATGGFNLDTMAVAAMGNFSAAPAPTAMVQSIGRVIGYRLAKLHRNPVGYRWLVAEDGSYKYQVGQHVRFNVISGHRQASATACPGDNLFHKLPAIRKAAKAWMGANLVEPRASGVVTQQGTTPDVSVRAGVLETQSWQLQISNACTGQVVRTFRGSATPSTPIAVSWGGMASTKAAAPPGRYRLYLTSGNASSRSVPWARTVVIGQTPAMRSLPATMPTPAAGTFVSLPPTLLASTSTGVGVLGPQLMGPGSRVGIAVLGQAGVPASGVSALLVAVTPSCASRPTTITAFPGRVAGSGEPVVSTAPGLAARGEAVVPVGPNGGIALRNAAGSVAVSVHVLGYWKTTGGAGVVPVTPQRIAQAVDATPSGVTEPVAGVGSIPAGAQGVVITVRARTGNQASKVTVWPAGQPKPRFANVLLDPGSRGSGRVFVPLSSGGAIAVAGNSATTRVALDADAYWSNTASTALHPVTPTPVLAPMRLSAASSVRVRVAGVAGVPTTGVRAVVLALSAHNATAQTALTVWPNRATKPVLPDVVVGSRHMSDGLVVVPVGAFGMVRLATETGTVTAGLTVVGWLG